MRVVPPYVHTYGPAACKLAAAAGLPCDPWQRDVVDAALGVDAAGRYAAFEVALWVSRQNGKGAVIEVRELAGLFLLGEKLIMHSAHEYKTAMEAFRRIVACIAKLGRKISDTLYHIDGPDGIIPVKVSNTNGDEGLERLDTGQRLRFIARSKGSGRGFSGDLIILDEAFALTPEMIEALMPTMSARDNPQIIYASSPPLSFESGEVMFGIRDRGEPEPDPEHPDDPAPDPAPELAYFDFGLAGDLDHLRHHDGCKVDCGEAEVDLDDEQNWRRTNPAYGIRISHRFTSRERRAMTDAGFARERLGIWPARKKSKDPAPIEPRLWVAGCDPVSKREGDVALGLDVTPMRDRAAIVLYGHRADGLGHVQVVSYASGVDWIVGRLLELREQLDPVAIYLDAAGAAGALLTRLKDAGIITTAERERRRVADGFPHRDAAEIPFTRGDLYIPTAREVAQWCGEFVDAARVLGMRHRNDPALNDAVAGAKFRPLGDSVGWGRRLATSDISPLVAATGARGCFYAVLERLEDDYDPAAYYV